MYCCSGKRKKKHKNTDNHIKQDPEKTSLGKSLIINTEHHQQSDCQSDSSDLSYHPDLLDFDHFTWNHLDRKSLASENYDTISLGQISFNTNIFKEIAKKNDCDFGEKVAENKILRKIDGIIDKKIQFERLPEVEKYDSTRIGSAGLGDAETDFGEIKGRTNKYGCGDGDMDIINLYNIHASNLDLSSNDWDNVFSNIQKRNNCDFKNQRNLLKARSSVLVKDCTKDDHHSQKALEKERLGLDPYLSFEGIDIDDPRNSYKFHQNFEYIDEQLKLLNNLQMNNKEQSSLSIATDVLLNDWPVLAEKYSVKDAKTQKAKTESQASDFSLTDAHPNLITNQSTCRSLASFDTWEILGGSYTCKFNSFTDVSFMSDLSRFSSKQNRSTNANKGMSTIHKNNFRKFPTSQSFTHKQNISWNRQNQIIKKSISFNDISYKTYSNTDSDFSLNVSDLELDDFCEDLVRKSVSRKVAAYSSSDSSFSSTLKALDLNFGSISAESVLSGDLLPLSIENTGACSLSSEEEGTLKNSIRVKTIQIDAPYQKASSIDINYNIPDIDVWFENEWEDICQRNDLGGKRMTDEILKNEQDKFKNKQRDDRKILPIYKAITFVNELNKVCDHN